MNKVKRDKSASGGTRREEGGSNDGIRFRWWWAVMLGVAVVTFGLVGMMVKVGSITSAIGQRSVVSLEEPVACPEEQVDRNNVCIRREIGDHMCAELFLLGVQKGGSSSLFTWVSTKFKGDFHVANAEGWRQKETHFFDVRYKNGLDWYASNFPVRNSTRDLAIDGTPDYSRYWMSAERIYKSLPHERLRFIISIRDPVARAYSWYRHVILEYVKDGSSYDVAYKAFDHKFSAMADYSPGMINRCINSQRDAREVHRECAYTNAIYWTHHGVVRSTGREVDQFQAVAMLFTDGLYGFILLHWFQYFDPVQFCVLNYEYLVKKFSKEIMNIEPCIHGVNREMPKDLGAFPHDNKKDCSGCEKIEVLSKDQLKAIGRRLHQDLYKTSNELFRSLLMTHYGRMDAISWEDMYMK